MSSGQADASAIRSFVNYDGECSTWRYLTHGSKQNAACTAQDHSGCMNSFTLPAYATNKTNVQPDIVPNGKVIRAIDPRNADDFADTFLAQFSNTSSFLSQFGN